MNEAIIRTDFEFPGQKNVYHGKVRDVYNKRAGAQPDRFQVS